MSDVNGVPKIHPATRPVERIFESAQAVIERGIGILVGAIGMADRGKMHDHLGVNVAQQMAERMIVARVLYVQGNLILLQKLDSFIHHLQH